MMRQIEADVHRQPFAIAADWQAAIAEQVRGDRVMSPRLADFLIGSGLLSRCCFLATAHGGGTLVMRHIAAMTVQVLGLAWARTQLGRPHTDDLYRDYAVTIDGQYREAIVGGEILLNRVALHGIRPTPVVYTQMLIGWSCGAHHAVLSAVERTA